MFPRAAEQVRRLAHDYRSRFTPSCLILLYHRVIELPTDPYLLAVSPAHFAEHLAVLRKAAHPIGLRQLAKGLRDGKIPRRSIAVTFDDGYFDNLDYAKPLLEHYDIPATFFVAPGASTDAGEFWWDALERIFLQPGSLPQTLRLTIDGMSDEWKLGSSAEYGIDDYASHRSWNYGRKDDPTPRQAVLRSVHRLLSSLSEDERRNTLQQLATWAGLDTAVRPTHRTLSSAQTIRLAEGRLLEVGAHTMTHPVLAKLPVAKQREEVYQSRARLEEMLGQPVTSFAYPHGLKPDYTQTTVDIVRHAGFDCACAAFPGIVRCGADVHQLPRFVVRDDDGDRFAERLWTYFHD
jgi:peptidoglycan/xylan/chitin deacetylase (PgdA/CDA1 family)